MSMETCRKLDKKPGRNPGKIRGHGLSPEKACRKLSKLRLPRFSILQGRVWNSRSHCWSDRSYCRVIKGVGQ